MLLENETYPEDSRVRKEARALVAAGHDVTVLAPRRPGQAADEIIDGVRVERYRRPTAEGGALGYLLEYGVAHAQLVPRVLRRLARGADVIHVHNPPDSLFVFGLVGRVLGRKLVYDHHDLTPELFELKFGSSPVVKALRLLQWLSFRLADEIVVTNDSQRTVALRAGADSHAVTVVRNGPAEASVVDEPGLRGGDLRDVHLVFVGSLESQDGVVDLAEILQRLRSIPRRAEARLTVVGDGGSRKALEQALDARGLTPHVRFTGRVPGDAVPRLIAEADICVDPAPCNPLNHRSTMIKIGEYLAAARPTVAYDLCETRHTAGDAALYARCGDVDHFVELLDRLGGDGALRRRLSERGTLRARDLTWERAADELRRVYERIGEDVTSRSAP